MQKLYMSVLIMVLRDFARPLRTCQYGFQAGCQPMDIIFVLMMLAKVHEEWHAPLIFIVADVRSFFDQLNHPTILAALADAGVPPDGPCYEKSLYVCDCPCDMVR